MLWPRTVKALKATSTLIRAKRPRWGVDQRVEIRDHIAFDVVFPCDDAPALARLYGLHDRGHVGQSDEVEVAECGELVGGRHCRLMGEGALRAQVKTVSCVP
mgnify:CR=1 FL=1